MADPEALQEVADARAVAGAKTHVALNVEVGEQRVLLEEVADPPLLRRDVPPAVGVEEHGVVDGHKSRLWTQQAGDDAESRRLTCTGRADQGERLAPGDAQVG